MDSTECRQALTIGDDVSKLIAIMTMSLDGYVADAGGVVSVVLGWYLNSGDVEVTTGGADPMSLRVSAASARHIRSLTSELGAVLTGRRTFEQAQGWGGNHSWGPAFVLTHQVPSGWPRPDSTVHFVTDGLDSAVRQAKAAAAGKSVGVHGADTIQQLLRAGLLDEISVDIAAMFLGAGIRLFDHLSPAVLGDPTVVTGAGVTHLRYPVRKSDRSPSGRSSSLTFWPGMNACRSTCTSSTIRMRAYSSTLA